MENTTVEVSIATAADDAEERLASNGISVNSSDLELGFDGSLEQLIGLRFTGLNIPPDAVITNAYIQFTVDEVSTGASSLVIGGQDSDDAQTFTSANSDVSTRPTTDASVAWVPPDWNTAGDSGVDQQTPDITAIIQEIVDRPGWTIDSALGLFISGTGTRTAESFNGSETGAPQLHVEYTVPTTGAPSIDLDGDNSSGATGLDFATAFIADGAAVAIADADTLITDSDSATLASATITITNPEANDVLTAGALPAGITVDPSSTATTLILIGAATPADYETAIEAVTFDNTSPTPVLGDRAITVVVNDGTTDSSAATATVTVLATNSAPTAVDDDVDANSDVALVITATDLTGNDSDPDGDALTITAVTDPANGTAVLNADGTVTYTSTPGYTGIDSFDYTVSDGNGGTDTATVTVDVTQAETTYTVDTRVAVSTDDAEEKLSSNSVSVTSSDLELGYDGAKEQQVGLRFTGLNIPPDAVITNAYVQFMVDEVSTGTADLVIGGQDADDAQTFASSNSDVSSRPTTTASVAWAPPDWNTVGDSGLDQQTPDITAVIQEIVDRPGWTIDSALALVISGTGRRTAESYNGGAAKAPLLHVEYTVPPSGAPRIDLDDDDSSGMTGTDFVTEFFSSGAAVAIADTDTLITDSNSASLASATITITNPEANDVLTAGTLPAGIIVDAASTATTLILTGAATLADYETAIEAVTFENTSPTPVVGDRTIDVVVNDGTDDSPTATTTVTVSAANSPPDAVADDVDAYAGIEKVIAASDLTGNDSDADGDTITITEITDPANGTAVLNADGTITYTATPGYTGIDSFDYTISDGNGGSDTATVTLDVIDVGSVQIIESRVATSSDDAEERLSDTTVSTTSSDIELGFDGSRAQLVGLRFNNLDIPTNAIILDAYIQFTADEVSTGTAALTISGEDVDDTQTFSSSSGDISSRPTTSASVDWTPPDWNVIGEKGVDQQTPNIAAVIQEIVDRPGWIEDNSLSLLISGSGRRTAEAADTNVLVAPKLHIEYAFPADGTARIDLDSDDNSGVGGTGFANKFFVDGLAVTIADADTVITDSDSATLASATITITNPESGDLLTAGSLPAGITVDASSTATTLILTGAATPDDYETAIEAVTFENTLSTPILGTRNVAVTLNDGTTDGPPAIASISVKEQAVEFLVIADVPYGDADFLALEEVLSNVSPAMEFVVHLGDIKSGGSSVDPAVYYPQVADTLKISSQPLFIVLGDNEYNDMPDPDAALAEWMDNFLYFDQNWNHDLGVMYQDIRPENFSFVIDQTLFVGLNLVGSTVHDADEWETRQADDLVWVEDMFAEFGTAVNNAVFFAQAAPSLSGYETFEAGFIAAAQDFDKPILYLQGDSHKWSLSEPYSEAPNITKVILDKTGPAGPLEVSVTNDPDDPFASDHDFGGMFL